MNKLIAEESPKKYKSWMKRTEKNDITKEVRVEEIENGFLVYLETYGHKNDKYFNESKKYYAKDNPLEGSDMVIDGGLNEAIDYFLENM